MSILFNLIIQWQYNSTANTTKEASVNTTQQLPLEFPSQFTLIQWQLQVKKLLLGLFNKLVLYIYTII